MGIWRKEEEPWDIKTDKEKSERAPCRRAADLSVGEERGFQVTAGA